MRIEMPSFWSKSEMALPSKKYYKMFLGIENVRDFRMNEYKHSLKGVVCLTSYSLLMVYLVKCDEYGFICLSS